MIPTRDEFRELLRDFISSDEYLDALMVQQHVMLFLKDVKNDVVLYVNDTVCQKMGRSFDDICGHPSSKNWPEEYLRFHQDDKEVLSSGVPKIRYAEHMGKVKVGQFLITSKAPADWYGEQCVIAMCLDIKSFIDSMNTIVFAGRVGNVMAQDSATDRLERMEGVLASIRANRQRFNNNLQRLRSESTG